MRLPVLLFFFVIVNRFQAQVADSTSIDQHTQDIQEVNISAVKKKEIIFDDRKCYIIDFSVTDKAKTVLLNHLNRYYISNLSEDFKALSRLELGFHPLSLFHDCSGNTDILSKDSIYQLAVRNNRIEICARYPISYYYKFLKDCVGELNDKVIFTLLTNFNQTNRFYSVDNKTRERELIYSIEDSMIVRSNKEHYINILSNNGGSSRMNELSQQQLTSARNQYANVAFFNLIISKPDYYPLFVKTDSIYIFDHLNNLVVVFDTSYKLVNSIPITYHLSKNWSKKIHFDRTMNQFYAVNVTNGIHELLLLSDDRFSIVRGTKITEHSFPKKIMVLDGYAYYTYKMSEDSNLNKLFRQKL